MCKFRTQFERRVVHKSFKGVNSMTDPQFEHDCTIEGIIRKYGILPKADVEPINMDVSAIGDFDECMRKVDEGRAMFAALPSDIRDRFGNDPRAFMSFLADPNNTDEAVRLGLMEKLVDEPSAVDVLKEISEKMSVTSKEEKQA